LNAKNAKIINAKNGMGELLYKELSYIFQGACFEIYKALGNGHKEHIYQNALAKS
jgi:hypothetical protein